MPGTYSQILFHIVFSTKHREPWITPDIAERLYPYMGGIVRAAPPRACSTTSAAWKTTCTGGGGPTLRCRT